ncbi:MAG: zinc ribbon domain-containing protein, partial [Deltaproteobacteria bacterium]
MRDIHLATQVAKTAATPQIPLAPEEAVMPIFEYRCQDCGAVFEILTLSGPAGQEKVRCSVCASGKVAKLISAGNIRQGKNSVPS